MKFAITYGNGQVFQHFGQTREFMVCTVEDGRMESEIVGSGEYSHGSLATLLQRLGVEALICGGIGDGARNMLKGNGITVYAGNSGDAEEVARRFVDGDLSATNRSTCRDHHDCHCH